jgi:hypothetical protein
VKIASTYTGKSLPKKRKAKNAQEWKRKERASRKRKIHGEEAGEGRRGKGGRLGAREKS